MKVNYLILILILLIMNVNYYLNFVANKITSI